MVLFNGSSMRGLAVDYSVSVVILSSKKSGTIQFIMALATSRSENKCLKPESVVASANLSAFIEVC